MDTSSDGEEASGQLRSERVPCMEPVSPSGEQVELSFGDQRAIVVGLGGGLRSYEVGGRAVLDGYGSDELCSSGRGQLLAPWPNRIEDGAYELDGSTYQLALDEPER